MEKFIDEKGFGRRVAMLRKEIGMTQDDMAERLHVSPQAISKWENGHSLPETALLPTLARLLDVSVDELFSINSLAILEAVFGDGLEAVNVTKRLSRLVESDTLEIVATPLLLGADVTGERASYLTVKYQSQNGICYAVVTEGEALRLTSLDDAGRLPESGLEIIAGCYGTKSHHYDVMHKIRHYQAFNWEAYSADHETFPSDPANDDVEYLTLVYINSGGIHMATCAEGESLAYDGCGEGLIRRHGGDECFLKDIPMLPSFGEGMECSWAAALTIALQAMGVKTTYEEVMGVSGACFRIAFCSPGWDYSSVDGLVAYDYATPGYAAFGYTPVMYSHIEKSDRPDHRSRIMKEIRNNMPVLGINLRVAPEWGIICGYGRDGEDLFCRTKYDKETIANDPEFMKGHPPFVEELHSWRGCLYVDNWPFLLCYFGVGNKRPTLRENLISSLRIFVDCAGKTDEGGYYMGFKAYEVWATDLRDDGFYESCDDEQMARRFSVNQFCALSLYDARKAAYTYLTKEAQSLSNKSLSKIAAYFEDVCLKAERIHQMLDSGEELGGERCRSFWTEEKRYLQAEIMDEMAAIERAAYVEAAAFLGNVQHEGAV